jgi:Arc/MetJ-type ribon-helix-helix transcriptional regulator
MTADLQSNEHDYLLTHRSSISMTRAMWERLEQVVVNRHEPKFKTSDAVREAIRLYLDQQEDLIGSRKHFIRSLQYSLTLQEQSIRFTLHILLLLVARLFVYLIKINDGRDIDPLVLIKSSIIESKKHHQELIHVTESIQKDQTLSSED